MVIWFPWVLIPTYDVVIIGSGPAGLTAGIYAARAHRSVVILEGPTPGGQLTKTSIVENWPGIHAIEGVTLMERMREHALLVGCTLLPDTAVHLDVHFRPFIVETEEHDKITARSVILATGASHRHLGCPGEQEYEGRGVSFCAVCDGCLFAGLPVVIVGGGNAALEYASYLRQWTDDVTIVQLLSHMTASPSLRTRVISDDAVHIIYDSCVRRIYGDDTGVTGVEIYNELTHRVTNLVTRGVFVAIGMEPVTGLVCDTVACDMCGFVSIHDHVYTSVPGVFAAGDVTSSCCKQAIAAAGDGCHAACAVERYLDTLYLDTLT